MKTKRTQSEIITTVLLVLVALAAVAVIAVFIINQVRTSAARAESKADCMKVDFAITVAKSLDKNITVQRLDDLSVSVKNLVITVNGATYNSTAVGPNVTLTTGIIPFTAALASGDKIELGAVLADGTVCATKATRTV